MTSTLSTSRVILVKSVLALTFILTAACGPENSQPAGSDEEVVGQVDTLAAEPKFCDPNTFSKYEKNIQRAGLERLHVYKIGKLTLAGLAVGDSDTSAVEQLAADLADVPRSEKSCTWYFNKGEKDAEAAFNHRYVPGPYFWVSQSKLVKAYSSVLNTSFDQDPINMVGCATKYNYVAMGCNGQKHRGPTGVAMFLAFAGCSPKNATKIVKQIWGSNNVPSEHREAIATKAYELGSQRPKARSQLQQLMLAR